MSATDSANMVDVAGPADIIEGDRLPITNGIGGPFYQEIARRKRVGRDAKILVTAEDGQTGVGKSNLCDWFGYIFDTSEQGFSPQKITIEPEEFFMLYSRIAPGSAAVLEEAEQLDSRQSWKDANIEGSQTWQKGRVREIIALLNLPSPKMIDKRFEELADYWVNVEIRGRAKVYKKGIRRISQDIYYKGIEKIHWPNMDGSDTFQYMDDIKNAHLDGEGVQQWIPEDEHEELVAKAVQEGKRDRRNEFIQSLVNETDLTTQEVANLTAVDVKQPQVSNISRRNND